MENIIIQNKMHRVNKAKRGVTMKVKEYLSNTEARQYHIFDTHQEKMAERGVEHQDQDFVAYSYNIHKNNKPCEGDVFLYRRPGKSSKTRRFYIYGGGVIRKITEPDTEGNVLAFIEKPFKLFDELTQDDSKHLEQFKWESKKKEQGSWAHFWNQYGMNVISEEDFFGLVGELDCHVPEIHNYSLAESLESVEEEKELNEDINSKGFIIDILDNGKYSNAEAKSCRKINGTHIDYQALQKKQKTLGDAGELLVMELLCEEYEGTETIIKHTAKVIGDGLGYDILVTHKDQSQEWIEVKTTKTPYVDGFYMTPKELNVARQCEADMSKKLKYKIYRIYSYDPIKKKANLKIYEGPFSDSNFRFMPTSWKVYEK